MRRYRFLVTVPVEVVAENVAQARRVAKATRLIGPGADHQPQKARINAVVGGHRPGVHDRDRTSWTLSVYPVHRVERVPV